MKKFLPILFSVFCFVFLSFAFRLPSSTFAQTSFDQALQDYQFTFGKYREAHDDYKLARNRYLASKTLANKQSALEATREMLAARANVMDTYFIALSIMLLETKPDESLKNLVLGKIDGQRNFIKNHLRQLSEKTTLEEVLQVSEKFEEQKGEFDSASYQALTAIKLGEQKLLTAKIENATLEAKNIISAVAQENDVALLNSWVNQIEAEVDTSKKAQGETRLTIEKFNNQRSSAKNLFSTANRELSESKTKLNKAISFLFELLNQIKTTQ